MNETLCTKKANDKEITELLSIYIEKVKWLSRHTISMWEISQFTRKSLKEMYVNPEYYIGLIGDKIIGGFILIETDERYWPNNEDKAYYLHKFVISNDFCGKGYSSVLLTLIKEHGKKNGKQYIRLDYDESRKYLHTMYLSNGFISTEKIINQKGKILTKAEYRIF